jgi:predicted dienelactone hydrolase
MPAERIGLSELGPGSPATGGLPIMRVITTMPAPKTMKSATGTAHILVALAALTAIAAALLQPQHGRDGLVVTAASADGIQVTVFRKVQGSGAPLLVITHGFAGSEQPMQPFAETLARNGYVAITFDFPGHRRNPAPLTGGLAD